MNAQDYEVVFNLAQHPYVGWLSASFPVIFVVIGIVVITMGERASTKAMGIFVLLFASVLTILFQLGAWQQYQRLQRVFHEGLFSEVEGRVVGLQHDYKTEIFSVGSHRFHISKPTITATYNGGAVVERQCVRLFYTDRDEIIWIGVRRAGCIPMEALQRNIPPPRMGWDP